MRRSNPREGGQRRLSDLMKSRSTSGLSAPFSRCRRTCRRTAVRRLSSARRRRNASGVTSHAPQAEQSSCTFTSKARKDAVRPQKRHTTISASLTRLIRSPLLALEGGGCFAPAPRMPLKNPPMLESHATPESYIRGAGGRCGDRTRDLLRVKGDPDSSSFVDVSGSVTSEVTPTVNEGEKGSSENQTELSTNCPAEGERPDQEDFVWAGFE